MEIVDKLFKSQVGHLTTFMINIQRVFQKLVISQFVDSLKFPPPPQIFRVCIEFRPREELPNTTKFNTKNWKFCCGEFHKNIRLVLKNVRYAEIGD